VVKINPAPTTDVWVGGKANTTTKSSLYHHKSPGSLNNKHQRWHFRVPAVKEEKSALENYYTADTSGPQQQTIY